MSNYRKFNEEVLREVKQECKNITIVQNYVLMRFTFRPNLNHGTLFQTNAASLS